MKCLTQSETEVWIREKIGEDILTMKTFGPWQLPPDAGRKMALSKLVFANLQWDKEGILLVTDWGIWPSCENILIFDRFRKSYGEGRSLFEAPGHLIDRSTVEEGEAILGLSLYFMWDVTLISEADKLLVQFDHHERIGLVGPDEESLQRVFQWLRNSLQ